MQTIKSSGAESKGMQVSYFSFIYVQNCQALSISQSLNPSLSLRDRDRADTIITLPHTVDFFCVVLVAQFTGLSKLLYSYLSLETGLVWCQTSD